MTARNDGKKMRETGRKLKGKMLYKQLIAKWL